MKEKIDDIAKGKFKSAPAVLALLPDQIKLETGSGESCEGSFTVNNSRNRMMRGLISTSCHYVSLEQDFFQGKTAVVKFRFDGKNLMPGEVIAGTILVITDCGSASVQFCVTVNLPSCAASCGKIRDLLHFTNLAKENSQEAVQLFKSKQFENVFLYRDNINTILYRGLLAGTSKGLAMEEFLIAIHKKLPIQLMVNQTKFEYSNCHVRFMDKVIITKDNWGFGEFHINSDAEFVRPEHKIIWADNFTGNKYNLAFFIDPAKMVAGNNYARIKITSVRQTIDIEISAVKPGVRHDVVMQSLNVQNRFYELTKLYLDFSMNRMERDEYIAAVEKIILNMPDRDMAIEIELLKVHLAIIGNRENVIKTGLLRLGHISERIYKKDTKLYCAFLYLKGLWASNSHERDECIREIKECYEDKDHSWQILWFLFYLDNVSETDRVRFNRIMEHLKTGCHSPVIYLEVCNILNDTPERLHDLSKEIVACLHWGCRNDYLEKELVMRYAYLAGRMKNYSALVLSDLHVLYGKYNDDSILSAICSTYMKGQVTSAEAFKWYALGIDRKLKLTDLYEHYMYSLDETQEIHLKQSVLLYFLYDNHLTAGKKAMLYAYIIRNKKQIPDAYNAYMDNIEEFCFEQLEQGRISENLAVIYEECINEATVTGSVAYELPKVMFSYEVICNNPDIAGVYVKHRELKDEEFVPLVHGRAIIHIFTEQSHVFLADGLDNRYTMSIDYTTNKLLNLDHLAAKCFEYNKTDMKLVLYLYDRAEHLRQTREPALELQREAINIKELSRNQYRKIFTSLLKYYFDNFEGELLDEALVSMDWDDVRSSDRIQIIEYCAVRHCYDKAMEGILKFGYEKISDKRLLQISSAAFEKNTDNENVQLLRLAWHIFNSGNFDENVLKYLCRFFWGTVQEEIKVWKAARGFEIECKDFEERIISQMVFTEEIPPESYNIFYSYCKYGDNKRLIKAFLKLAAYKYLIKDWLLPNEMFQYFYDEVKTQENMHCLIATLKYLSQKDNLTDEEKETADYHVNLLYKKNIVFSFYKDFWGKFTLPIHIMNQHYVEYIARPECEVKIHYLISQGQANPRPDEKFTTETMRNVFQGIRVKEFVLFQDELLQYYISETSEEGEKITRSASVHFNGSMDNAWEGSRYHALNTIMIAKQMNDDATLINMMEEYAKERENIKQLFKPIH
ncbi:MAG TPA: hypothetical protein DCZ23_04255 [Lachnospiraceae bacterium]|nr:hypothetical protein [Lachnospiraceae bacterium]